MNRKLRYYLVTALAGVAAGLLFSGQSFILAILSQVLVFAIAALGLNLLTGQAGQVSIGNAAFMSIGAFTSAVLVTRTGLPMPLAVIAAAAMAALFGLVIGLPALRMKGFYLAIATMAFGVVVEQLIAVVPALGSHDGLRDLPSPVKGELGTYFVNLAFYLAAIWVARRVVESPQGLRWRMTRDGEVSARSFGINTSRAKLSAFVASAAFGGVAGALYAHTVGYIRSADFGLSRSLDLLAMIMIGGSGSIQGGLAGAIIIIGLRFFFSRGFGPWLSVIIGGLLIAFTLFFPRGIAYGLTMAWHKALQRPLNAVRRRLTLARTRKTGSYVEAGGWKIFFREQGSGEPLLYVHGNTGSLRWFEGVMDLPGRRVIALDMPNFGRSDALGAPADIGAYADAVAAFMDALGLRGIPVVGHSLGGAVVQCLACRRPELASAILLVDPAPPSGLVTPEERYASIGLFRTSRDLLAASLEAVAPSLRDKGRLSPLVDDALLMASDAFEGNARALARFDCKASTGAYRGKVLVLRGGKDSIVTSAMAEETAASFPGARLEILEGVGHSVMVEDPDRFIGIVKTFIESL
jgi:branched-chain amino acid transport system permease protein